MKTKNLVIIALLAILVFIGFSGFIKKNTPQTLGDITPTMFAPMSDTGVLCGFGSSTPLVATSSSRQYIRISNNSGNTIFLGMGVPAASSSGIMLTASSSIEFNETNLFGGAIYCLGWGAAGSTTVAEEK